MISQLLTVFLLLIPIAAASSVFATNNPLPYSEKSRPVKNLIILIPDGCGVAHMSIARWCKKGPLAQDAMHPGLVMTHSTNSAITGSAAAATAIATGYKTWEDGKKARCLSLLPDSIIVPTPERLSDNDAWRPVATLLEAARFSGRSTGLVANSNINHATPAAFSAHWHDREHGNAITLQQVFGSIDVVLAGGLANLLPVGNEGGKRTDGENLTRVLQQRGYQFVTTGTGLSALPAGATRVWGAFSDDFLLYDRDRTTLSSREPSLADCTRKAIELLSKNRKGFFLMVEGSEVDWASHNNDPVGVITEYLAFDSAVSVALDFAKSNGSTEVLVFPDHDNGGMSMGIRGDDYTSTSPVPLITCIDACALTCKGFLDSLIRYSNTRGPVDWKIAGNHLESVLHIDSLGPDDDIFAIAASASNKQNGKKDVAAVGSIISRRCNIGWTTFGHTGHTVPMYGFILQPTATFDNTDIAHYCARILKVDLDKTSTALFSPAPELFDAEGTTLTIDSVGATEGKGSLTVKRGDFSAVFSFNKDFFTFGTDTIDLPGIVLYSQMSHTVYLPREAGKLFKRVMK